LHLGLFTFSGKSFAERNFYLKNPFRALAFLSVVFMIDSVLPEIGKRYRMLIIMIHTDFILN
jgi:hypothetical protein